MADINKRAKLIGGLDDNGNVVPLKVEPDGSLVTTGGSGGGGSGGATEAEVKNAIETATNLNDVETILTNIFNNNGTEGSIVTGIDNAQAFNVLGFRSESTATSDTGTFSLVQFFKRLLSVKIPNFRITSAPSTSTNPTVDTSADLVLPANPNRIKYIITASGNAPVFLDYANTLTTSNYAVPLNQGDSVIEDQIVYTGEIWAIAASSTTISVREWSN
jgi:hypothetical protein